MLLAVFFSFCFLLLLLYPSLPNQRSDERYEGISHCVHAHFFLRSFVVSRDRHSNSRSLQSRNVHVHFALRGTWTYVYVFAKERINKARQQFSRALTKTLAIRLNVDHKNPHTFISQLRSGPALSGRLRSASMFGHAPQVHFWYIVSHNPIIIGNQVKSCTYG